MFAYERLDLRPVRQNEHQSSEQLSQSPKEKPGMLVRVDEQVSYQEGGYSGNHDD